jgi:hypothetical protein
MVVDCNNSETLSPMSDSIALFQDQLDALNQLYLGFNCTQEQMICPTIGEGDACPKLVDGVYGPRLICQGGNVIVLGFDRQFPFRGATMSAALGRLTRLGQLLIDDQGGGLSGTIPTQIGLLGSLTTLDLCCNDLSGTVPTQLARLTSLRWLGLHGNRLSGSIPEAVAGMPSLRGVRFYNNQLSGAVARFVGIGADNDSSCELVSVENPRVDRNCFSECATARCCATCCGEKLCQMTTKTSTISMTMRNMTTTNFVASSVLLSSTPQKVQQQFPLAIVLGVLGVLAFLIVLILIIVIVMRRRRRQRLAAATQQQQKPQSIVDSVKSTSDYAAVTIARDNYDVGNVDWN